MTEDFNVSIKVMVEQFHSTVRDMAGEEMERFSSQLRDLHSQYVDANKNLIDSNSSMLSSITQQSDVTLSQTKQITEQLFDSTDKVSNFTTDLYQRFELLQKHMQQWVFDTLEDSKNVIHSDLMAAGHSLKENASLAGDELKSAGTIFNQGLQDNIQHLSDAGKLLKEDAQSAGEVLKSQANLAGTELHNAGSHFNEGLQTSIQSLSSAGELLKEDAQLAGDALKTSANMAGSDIQSAGAAFNESVQTSVQNVSTASNLLKEDVESAGETLKNSANMAGSEIQSAGAAFNETIQTSAQNVTTASNLFKEDARLAGGLLTEGASEAGQEIATAGKALSAEVQQSSEALSGITEQLNQHSTAAIENVLGSVGDILKEQASEAGQELIFGSQKAAGHIAEGGASIGMEAKTVGEAFSGAMTGIVEEAQLAGKTMASEINDSVRAIAKDQEAWAARHEQAAEALINNVEEVANGIRETSHNALSNWSDKVADASASLALASDCTGKLAESMQPVLSSQEQVTRELSERAEQLSKASENSQPVQELIAERLKQSEESCELLAATIDDAAKTNADMEGHLERLSEEFASQYARFSDNLQAQLKAQKNSWDKQEKTMSSMVEGHSKRVLSLDEDITKAMENLADGLQTFAANTSDFVRGLDHNASDILETLSSAIEKMQTLEDRKSADELKALVASVKGVQDIIESMTKQSVEEAAG